MKIADLEVGDTFYKDGDVCTKVSSVQYDCNGDVVPFGPSTMCDDSITTASHSATAYHCWDCVWKHLTKAMVQSLELPFHPEELDHIIGNLACAEDHCPSAALQEAIRDARLNYMDGGTPDLAV